MEEGIVSSIKMVGFIWNFGFQRTVKHDNIENIDRKVQGVFSRDGSRIRR